MCLLKARIKTLIIGVLLIFILLPCPVYAVTQEASTLPLAINIVISPAESTIFVGQSQAYTATATAADNTTFDVTSFTTFDIDDEAGGTWLDNVYTSEATGEWTVTGTYEGLTDNATLTVKPWGVEETIIGAQEDQQVTLPEANTTITVDTTDNVTISIGKYDSNPHPEALLPASMLPRYIDIEVSNPDAIDWPMHVEQTYTDDEVAGLDESSLGMYYFKTADNAWHKCEFTGVNMVDNYIWADMLKDEVSGSPIAIGGNHLPVLGSITAPVEPVQVNTVINVSASFTDPDTLDTHTATWDWGDGSTSDGAVTKTNGSGFVSGSHAYSNAGVYTVTLTVTDDDGGTGHSTFQYVVIYDPSAGFVTGGGWINSPPGAYKADPALTGKATFGFVSKYQKGAKVPTGETEFRFHVANLNFHSDSYDWLVIAGPKAQYKGIGTINGTGEYGFMLTAIDGQIKGGGGADKFRMKIWDKATGNIIYDNQMGAGDDAAPTTAIAGGSIIIHKE